MINAVLRPLWLLLLVFVLDEEAVTEEEGKEGDGLDPVLLPEVDNWVDE